MNFFVKAIYNFFKFLYPFKIYGTENIIEDGAVVVSNHFKFVDPMFLYEAFGKNSSFIAKKELFDNKLVGAIIKNFGAIPITRENPDIKELITCIKVLKKGQKLVIFPEGTRNRTKTDELQSIKGGAGVFAVKAKTPVIPVMLLKKSKIFRKTHVLIGKPFTLEEFYDQKLTDDVVSQMDDFIREKMLEVQRDLKELKNKKATSK